MPKTVKIIPVTRLRVAGFALFASTAAILAHSKVETMQMIKHQRSGIPPITKWLIEPVNAVNVIINTLVPTAVFSSYPKTLVKTSNIIIPPPAPMNPQTNPTSYPIIMD